MTVQGTFSTGSTSEPQQIQEKHHQQPLLLEQRQQQQQQHKRPLRAPIGLDFYESEGHYGPISSAIAD